MTENWVALLRTRGYRLTQQRKQVLYAVRALGHGTPDQLHTYLQQRQETVDLATVYRTLELLVELGLVGHTRLDSSAETYHLVTHADHVHLVCRGCSQVSEAPTGSARDFAERLLAEHQFTADLGHLVVHGWCANCTTT